MVEGEVEKKSRKLVWEWSLSPIRTWLEGIARAKVKAVPVRFFRGELGGS